MSTVVNRGRYMEIELLVTIGITTKNRFLDMEMTLKKLITLGLNHIPIIIYDDASEEPLASPETLDKFDNLTVVRNEISRGLIVNRNRIVEMAKTPYIISLDDDSCFAEFPPLDQAIEYLENNLSVIGLEFLNIDVNAPSNDSKQLLSNSIIYAVKSYTGCGHLIRRETFLSLGGYREYFVHMSEESDLAQRAWAKGYEIHRFPNIVIHHRRTPKARIPEKIAFYNARNIALCNLLNKPLLAGFFRAAGLYPILLSKNLRYPNLIWKITLGWLNALGYAITHINERTPMSWKQYHLYQNLPSVRQ